MPDQVDISGLDKAEVLVALYDAAAATNPQAPPLSLETARLILDQDVAARRPLYRDAINGRQLQVDLTGPTFHAGRYNRHNGVDAGARIVQGVRDRLAAAAKAAADKAAAEKAAAEKAAQDEAARAKAAEPPAPAVAPAQAVAPAAPAAVTPAPAPAPAPESRPVPPLPPTPPFPAPGPKSA